MFMQLMLEPIKCQNRDLNPMSYSYTNIGFNPLVDYYLGQYTGAVKNYLSNNPSEDYYLDRWECSLGECRHDYGGVQRGLLRVR